MSEEATEKTEVVEDNSQNETKEVLKDIRDHLSKSNTKEAPTQQQLRDAIKEQTGFTDAQLDFAEKMNRTAVISAVAPLQEEVAWGRLEKEVGQIDSEVEQMMKKELADYPIEKRGDKVLLEKVYYMSLGRMGYRKGSMEKTETGRDENVVSRRVVSSSQGSSRGLDGNANRSTVKISDQEKAVAKKYNMTDQEYAEYKGNKYIQSFKK